MSQYALIPTQNASKLKLEYNVANPSTWGLFAHDIQWSGIEQDPELSQEQREEILSLGGVIFESPEQFHAWL